MADGKETFLDLVKLGSQAKKRESRPTEIRREAWEAGQEQSQRIWKCFEPKLEKASCLSQNVVKQGALLIPRRSELMPQSGQI